MTATTTALDALLESLPRASFIVGKGGVGKTTLAIGIAASFARRGRKTLVMSTDPAAALGALLGSNTSTVPAVVTGELNLEALQLSAPRLRTGFLDRWRDVIAEIVDRGTYLDRADVDGLVDAALPGADEIFGLLALADILADASGHYERIIIDTAPTGHTLRLLALPDTFRALLAMLDTMQDKHRFMVHALTHRYRRDRADAFLAEMRTKIDGLRATLSDGAALAAVVVTRAEPMVEAETTRYIEALGAVRIRVAAVVVNAIPDAAHSTLQADVPPAVYRMPRSSTPPSSLQSIAELTQTLSLAETVPPTADTRATGAQGSTADRRAPLALPFLPSLSVIGGKGGVGKTTVACALAIDAVDHDRQPTLLVSTDPAASIADALGAADAGWARLDIEHVLTEVPGLTVRQMDAGAAFARVRDEYQARIDALFESIVGRGLDAAHDRAVLRDLLALAPPGIDELFALSILGDALAEGRFARVIVDPAPTGHLLRLLDMPAVALDWTHRLMRLMLKYRDIVGPGDTAQELLAFARRTRALDALLHDAARCTVILVTLDEPVVRAETARLGTAIRERAIDVSAIVWNRTSHEPAPLPEARTAHQFLAYETDPPPIGVDALRAWIESWTPSSTTI